MTDRAPVTHIQTDPGQHKFLQATAVAGGGLLIGVTLGGCSEQGAKPGSMEVLPQRVQPNAWLAIAPDNTITFLLGQAEMGQGVYTALPTLLAEELGG